MAQNHISAESLSLSDVFSDSRFQPAEVQREFQWTSDEAMQLLDDLFKVFSALGLDPQPSTGNASRIQQADVKAEAECEQAEETAFDDFADEEELEPEPDDDWINEHDFSGNSNADTDQVPIAPQGQKSDRTPPVYNLNTIVLYGRPRQQGGYFVFDGMQRLTTLTLLIVALRDTADHDVQVYKWADEMLYFSGNKNQHRLMYSTGQAGTLRRTINKTSLFTDVKSSADRRVREVYRAFCGELETWTDNRRREFLGFLRDNVFLTRQTLTNWSLAYQTFITANDRGRMLALGDIFKGYLVELAHEGGARPAEIAKLDQSWRDIRDLVRSHDMGRFIKAVETLKLGFDPVAAPGERLLSHCRVSYSAEDLVAFVEKEMKEQARLFSLQQSHLDMERTNGVDLHFRQLSFLDWDEWRAVAIAMASSHDGDLTDAAWCDKIARLYRACYTMELLWRSSPARTNRMQAALTDLDAVPPRDPFDKDAEGPLTISEYLQYKAKENLKRPFVHPAKRRSVMRWLETLLWQSDDPPGVPRNCTTGVTVEHIVPLSLTPDWTKAFTEQQHDKVCNLIGNLCIIPGEINKQIGNGSWLSKKHAFMKLKEEFKLAGQVTVEKKWTPSEVRNWTKKLAKLGADELKFGPTPKGIVEQSRKELIERRDQRTKKERRKRR